MEDTRLERDKISTDKKKIQQDLNNCSSDDKVKKSAANNRLKDCVNRMKDLENRKADKSKDININLDGDLKKIENKIEKNQDEQKNNFNTLIIKENKLKENLGLIDNKIRNIVEDLPKLNHHSHNEIKKEMIENNNGQKENKNNKGKNIFCKKFLFKK